MGAEIPYIGPLPSRSPRSGAPCHEVRLHKKLSDDINRSALRRLVVETRTPDEFEFHARQLGLVKAEATSNQLSDIWIQLQPQEHTDGG